MTIFLWNIALATAAGILLALAGRFRHFQALPALRHALWLLVLAKLITPPLLPLPILPPSESVGIADKKLREPGPVLAAAATTPSTVSLRPDDVAQTDGADGVVGREADETSTTPGPEIVRPESVTAGSSSPFQGRQLILLLAGLSLFGTIVLWSHDVGKTLQLARLLRRATPGGERLQQLATQAALRLRLAKVAQIRVVAGRVTPFLWAGWRPVVALPLTLVDEFDDEQVDCVISHELAHYRRRDHWSNAFAFLVASLFWWHPLVWWARRELRSAQDLCCDALVIGGHAAKRRCYAQTLLRAVEFVALERPNMPALASEFGPMSSITRRFEMIADPRLRHGLPRWSYGLIVAAVAILACIPIRPILHAQESPPEPGVLNPPVEVDPDAEIANPSWRLLHLIHPAHRQTIWHVAFSPDGKTIASAAMDKTTRLWDVETGRLLVTIKRPVNCTCVAFSPDGRTLAISGGDGGVDPPGELVLWNLVKGEVQTEFLNHTTAKYVRWTAFSPDGQWLAAGGTDKSVTIWNVAQGKLHHRLLGHTGLVASVAFSPDGTRLASGSFDRSIRFWDVPTGKSLAILEGHEAEIRTVAFAPDGELLLSTSDDHTARFWDTRTFEQVTVMHGHDGKVLCGAFAPDGRHVVTAGMTSGGRIVLLRDVPSGDWGHMDLFPAQASDIMSVAFSRDGDTLAILGAYGNFQIWKRSRSGPAAKSTAARQEAPAPSKNQTNEEKLPRGQEEKLRVLIDKVLAAHGGEEKLSNLKFTEKVEQTHEDDMVTIERFVQPPDQLRVELQRKGVATRQIQIGSKRWTKHPNGKVEPLELLGAERPIEYYLDFVKFFGPRRVLRLRDADHRVAWLDEVMIDERPAVGVELNKAVPTFKLSLKMFFDKETNLLVKQENVLSSSSVSYSDYQKFDGIPVARKETQTANGKVVRETEVTDFRAVDKLDAKLFEQP